MNTSVNDLLIIYVQEHTQGNKNRNNK